MAWNIAGRGGVGGGRQIDYPWDSAQWRLPPLLPSFDATLNQASSVPSICQVAVEDLRHLRRSPLRLYGAAGGRASGNTKFQREQNGHDYDRRLQSSFKQFDHRDKPRHLASRLLLNLAGTVERNYCTRNLEGNILQVPRQVQTPMNTSLRASITQQRLCTPGAKAKCSCIASTSSRSSSGSVD